MTTSRRVVLIGVLAAVTFGGCDLGLPPDVAKLGYVSREHKFAMNVPAGWTVRESSGAAAAILVGPGTVAEGRPNVTVVVDNGFEGVTLAEFVRLNRTHVGALPGYQAIAEEPRTLADGHKAVVLTFEQAALGKPVRQRQMYVLAGGRGYVVTATASPPEAWAAREGDFETVFRSFRAAW